ncbi:agmatinase [Aureibacter tunicatorum]|uniref:Agmatinase n=1 Tax=Aureibacter tunicatorum TaxID=866807 RepID=A0AAE3XML7_9BACT|nr:agmatinase [Aureibacter tunicatorum]MDR6239732.1 agmatinase [Aureibacter tunicatorum]BDD04208.1 agmatinase [Aureibacter tunicatorum]
MKNKRTYLGVEDSFGEFETASILLQSIPYDGTSTWGKGADLGFESFLEASENMELYDIETNSEVYKKGVSILPEISESESPEAVFETVYRQTKHLLEQNKFLTFFGGEHSVSIGIMEAYREKFPDMSVLQLDAHTDLRKSYNGSEYNHACAMHKISRTNNLVQVGIRSMDTSELAYLNREKCFFAEEMYGNTDWVNKSLDLLGEDVYLSIDLDVFDPSIMPSTGTPEPGGMDWNTTIQYLKLVFQQKNVVGFDIVEFAPIQSLKAPDFLVAKLYYKLLSYKYNV